jgi:hypothetical protein
LTQKREKPDGKILNLPANKDSKNNTLPFLIPITSPIRIGGEAQWIKAKVDF